MYRKDEGMGTDLKEKQKEMLKMLKIIDDVCSKYGLKYTLVWGSTLGAIRHQGFIPWDDDADISMLWSDYKKLLQVWEKEVDTDCYFIQSYDNDKKYPMLYPKVRSRKIDAKEKIFDQVGIEEGVWIDIFPVINISDNKIIEKFQRKFMAIANFLNHKYFYMSNSKFLNENFNHVKLKSFLFRFFPDFLRCKMVKIIMNKVAGVNKSKNVCVIGSESHTLIESKYYTNLVKTPFENTELYIQEDWDEYLTKCYGDYMTPVKYSHDLIE